MKLFLPLFVAPFFVFFTGVFGYLFPAIGYFTMMPGNMGDARFNSIILEHGYQMVSGTSAETMEPGFFLSF